MITIHVEKTASRGIVIGKAFILEQPEYNITNHSKEEANPQQELGRFESAVSTAVAELEKLADTNSIFEAHLEMVKDITLQEGVVSKIREERITVEAALEAVISEFLMIFESMDDEYMRERAADIKDIRNRLMRALSGAQENHLEAIKEEVILVAKDLTPSDTAALNLSYILGFVTVEGGVTSHVSIMAKGLGIPALVGVKDILPKVKNDDILIMDAGKGQIIINPDEETLYRYQQLREDYRKKQEELEQIDQLPAVTLDGREVHLCVNIGGLGDIRKALTFQMDGVGLFRSEFLYMDNTHFPTEEEQFLIYKEAVQLCSKEVIIRTLDIGGDKSLPYYEFEKEENPFLGWRAIRISLELNDIFKAQLRAILRASAFGAAKIMFPMIISVEELREAKVILEECKKELTELGIAYNENIKVGIMVETPASIILIDDLAKEVDFISIGTNDLTQYLLAVDRGNKKISNLYNSFHPAVIRSIKRVIEAGHRNNINVGMCGEFASDEKAVKLLLGLGLDEFSMSASELWNVKTIIRNSSYEEVKGMANLACEQATLKEVYEVLGIQK
ncbi:MAG: phosphoenolpyruvate--protein phosphotransferase [Mobilitalea sp.]